MPKVNVTKVKVTKAFIKKLEKSSSDIQLFDVETLTKIISLANKAYHADGEPLIGDDLFDVIKDRLHELDPTNPVLKEVGASNENSEKIELPFWMGSMDKIKNDEVSLTKWSKENGQEVVISDKLDGVSALCVKSDNGEISLFTRGDGSVGQLISRIVPDIIGLKNTKGGAFIVRGELILSREDFEEIKNGSSNAVKVTSNARNVVAGVINATKNPNKIILNKVRFVAYELVTCNVEKNKEVKSKSPFEQLCIMKNVHGLEVVNNTMSSNINVQSLSDHLSKRKKSSSYDIDGLVIYQNNPYLKNTSGNPSNAFAFKMQTEEANVTVTEVKWKMSKDRYMKPVVWFESVYLNGVTINKASGFNAKYIVDNQINTGSVICITRSGEVIPYIVKVIVKSKEPGLPNDIGYVWNKTNVDIIANNETDESSFTDYANTITSLKMKGLQEGTIRKLFNNGINTMFKLFTVTKEQLLMVETIKEKSASNILGSIEQTKADLSLEKLMIASNIFGRGIAGKTTISILEKYPDILTKFKSDKECISELEQINGIQTKTATQFCENINSFKQYMKQHKLEQYITRTLHKEKVNKKTKDTNLSRDTKDSFKNTLFLDHIYLLSGSRDKNIIQKIEDEGGIVSDTMKKSVTHLITKTSKASKSTKEKAVEKENDRRRELNQKLIEIITYEEFIQKYL